MPFCNSSYLAPDIKKLNEQAVAENLNIKAAAGEFDKIVDCKNANIIRDDLFA